MPATLQSVREIASGWPAVEEGVCYGTPTFYLRKKLMLRMREDGETLVVKLPMADREQLVAADPDVFSYTDHYKNYPVVLVYLPSVRLEILTKMIEGAWRQLASKTQIAAYEKKQRCGR